MSTEKESVVEKSVPPSGTVPKKKRRLWLKLLGVVLALLVVALVAVWLFLDAAIVKGIQVIGSKATGTSVRVESFSSALLRGKVTIRNLSVGNPEGCQLPDALAFTTLEVQLQPSSLFSDTIVIERITIEGLRVDFEPSLSEGSNLNRILNHVKEFTGASDAAAKEETSGPAAGEKPAPAKKVVIRLVEVRDAGIVIASSTLGTQLPVPLPDLTMTDIGEQRSIGAAIQAFFAELLDAVGRAIAGSGITSIDVSALGAGLSDAAQGAVGQLGSGLSSAAEGIGAGLSGAGLSGAAGTLSDGASQAGESINGGVKAIKELF